MLKATFLLFNGIGPKTERQYWSEGVTDLDSLAASFPRQFQLFKGSDELDDPIEISKRAIAEGDVSFFSRRLPPREFYRIALSFPEDVIFLDIETTGLSLYYDNITVVGWSLNGKYGVYKTGDSPTPMLNALKQAKVVVTFNGTMFDLKFLARDFAEILFPPAHLDLRYFAKRVGLSGGQKAIEIEIGHRRGDQIKSMLGENAPVLWHEYRRGNLKALKRLIKYNHADVEGMKVILDYAIDKFLDQEEVPRSIRPAVRFSSDTSKLSFSTSPDKRGIFLTPFEGSTKPLINYSDLNTIQCLDNFTVVGIDLVSSEKRETGFCTLKGNLAETCRIHSDQEMIDLALSKDVDLVSIDSPLSIPYGRTTCFDDDPARQEYGITRECERALAKRGINSYPCLIQSMQKLTKRGMELASKFRRLGVPVIESYPGAAQDIMQIPRKQSGLEYLTAGLAEFGIKGAFVKNAVSHDELDAITSAIVGHFFWAGKFEALGNPNEKYLFVPDIQANPENWIGRKVLGLSGHIAAGKTTVAEYLHAQNYRVTRYSLVLEDMLKEDNLAVNRESLQELGRWVNKEKGQRWLGTQVVNRVVDAKLIAVDGIRFLEDRAFMVEVFGPAFELLYIDAPRELRHQRMLDLARENLSAADASKSLTESQIDLLISKADIVIKNNSTIKSLYKTLDRKLGGQNACQ